jgi:hypothetical protein
MPFSRKPDPEKYCEFCGKRLAMKGFSKRKYCDMTCTAKAFDAKPVKERPTSTTAHWHSRKMIPPGPCMRCGNSNASDVHHKNGDWTDNRLENLERICRSCHLKEHSRRTPCVICGKPQKGLGYCNKHYIRFKKYGDPLAYKVPPRKMCRVCGQPAHAKGLCGKHFMQEKRGKLSPP